MNERNTLKNSNGSLEIGGVKASDLAKNFGTPLYVFDEEHIINICNTFNNALKTYYGNGMISYASKAFCCKEIYRIINKLSLGTDVVSLGELKTALSVNFPSEKIIFHGNNKSFVELEEAIKNSVKYIVIDSELELEFINKLCEKYNKIQDVLIRVNPGVEAHTHQYIQTARTDSKFGFSTSNGDADKFIERVVSYKNLSLKGLHCHIGSQIFEKNSFVIAVEKMTDYYLHLKNEFGLDFQVLDLGGGFGIYYSKNDPKTTLKDYEEYVETISNALNENVKAKGLTKPYLILEPGRAIVGEAGITLYTAGSIKNITDVKKYISIDGGLFENPRFALYQAEYTVVAADKLNNNANEKYSIAGKCCESGDLIAEDVYLPEINSGDILAVLSTGAYNYSMASNYNRNQIPAVVMVKNGKSRVVVKSQSIEDLLRNDI